MGRKLALRSVMLPTIGVKDVFLRFVILATFFNVF